MYPCIFLWYWQRGVSSRSNLMSETHFYQLFTLRWFTLMHVAKRWKQDTTTLSLAANRTHPARDRASLCWHSPGTQTELSVEQIQPRHFEQTEGKNRKMSWESTNLMEFTVKVQDIAGHGPAVTSKYVEDHSNAFLKKNSIGQRRAFRSCITYQAHIHQN